MSIALIAEDDLVAGHFVGRGTQIRALLNGVPPSGRSWEARATAIYRVETGRIAEAWVNWDQLSLMEQLRRSRAREHRQRVRKERGNGMKVRIILALVAPVVLAAAFTTSSFGLSSSQVVRSNAAELDLRDRSQKLKLRAKEPIHVDIRLVTLRRERAHRLARTRRPVGADREDRELDRVRARRQGVQRDDVRAGRGIRAQRGCPQLPCRR